MNARIKKKKKAWRERGKCCFPENTSCFDLYLTCLNMPQLKTTFLQNVLTLGLSTLAAYNSTFPTLILKLRKKLIKWCRKDNYRLQKFDYLFVHCHKKRKTTCATTYYCSYNTAYRQCQSPAWRVRVQWWNHKCAHALMHILRQLFCFLETTNQNKLWH